MNTVTNVANLIIAKNSTRAANTTIGGGVTSATLASSCVADTSNIADGEVVVTDQSGYVLRPDTSGLTAIEKVFLVQGQAAGFPLLRSDAIFRSNVTRYKGTAYSQCTEQVDYIGYNGATSAGSIEVINSNVYEVDSLLRPTSFMFGDKLNHVFGSYKSTASATQSAIALGLSQNLILNTKYWPNIPYKVERVNDATTLTAFTGTADMIKLTKGSTTVYFWLSTSNAASTGSITTGDVISLPTSDGKSFTYLATTNAVRIYIGTTLYAVADAGSAAQNAAAQVTAINAGNQARAVTDTNTDSVIITPLNNVKFPPPVVWDVTAAGFIAVGITTGNTVPTKYIASATVSTAASFELDQAYQGETGIFAENTGTTTAILTTNVGVATVITAWGLKSTGISTQFRAGAKRYEKSRWATVLINCGATNIATASTVANEGTGMYEQIAEMEWFFQGFLGKLERIQIPPVQFIANTETTGNYSLINMSFYDKQGTNILGNPASYKELYIAGNKTGGYSGSTLASGTVTNTVNQFAGTTDSSASVVDTLDAWLNGLFAAQIANV